MRVPRIGVVALAAAGWWGPGAAARSAVLARLLGVPLSMTGQGDCEGDAVALTFDDGPDPRGTPAVLDALGAAGATATFFLVGEQVRRRPSLVTELVAAGHEPAVHTDRHRCQLRLTPGTFTDDLARAVATIAEAAGRAPSLYRPPYGAFTLGGLCEARRAGLEPLLWSRWGRDWRSEATGHGGQRTPSTLLPHRHRHRRHRLRVSDRRPRQQVRGKDAPLPGSLWVSRRSGGLRRIANDRPKEVAIMAIATTSKLRTGAAAAAIGAALALAACGGSGSGSGASGAMSSSGSATATAAAATGAAISVRHGSDGAYLTGASGRALYLWMADSRGHSRCSGACAQVWPPVLSKNKPIAGHGAVAADLGTIARSGGQRQVTYNGHPLYYYVADSRAGSITGEGSNGFGAKWWLVSPSGAAITHGHSGTAASGGSSGSSGGGGWG